MSFEEQLVNKINQFRANPKGYAKKINEYVQYFKGNTLKIPGTKRGIDTEEGAAAYIEAVDFLAKQEGIDPLEPSKGLGRICADFMEKAENLNPEEIGNIDLEEIIKKYGKFKGDLNRAIDFGGEDPEQVLINLIVCDGDPNRGNRESLLSTDLKKIGIKHCKHSTYRFCTLIISCTKFINNVDSDDYGFFGKDALLSDFGAKPISDVSEHLNSYNIVDYSRYYVGEMIKDFTGSCEASSKDDNQFCSIMRVLYYQALSKVSHREEQVDAMNRALGIYSSDELDKYLPTSSLYTLNKATSTGTGASN